MNKTQLCEENLQAVEFGDNLGRMNEAITDAVIRAVLQYIPCSKGRDRKKRVPYCNDGCDR